MQLGHEINTNASCVAPPETSRSTARTVMVVVLDHHLTVMSVQRHVRIVSCGRVARACGEHERRAAREGIYLQLTGHHPAMVGMARARCARWVRVASLGPAIVTV